MFALQPFALLITLAYSRLFSEWGADSANYFLNGLLALGLVSTIAIPKQYRRLRAEAALQSKQLAAQTAAPPPPVLQHI